MKTTKNLKFFKENTFWRMFYTIASITGLFMLIIHHFSSIPGFMFVMGSLCFILNFAPLQMEIKGI